MYNLQLMINNVPNADFFLFNCDCLFYNFLIILIMIVNVLF